MFCPTWLQSCLLLLLAGLFAIASGAFIGVDIGTDVSSLPAASEMIAILKLHGISHVRLFDANVHMLSALANSSIEVIVGVTNENILRIGRSPSTAAAWVNKYVAPYLPDTNITAIAVGSEVLTSIPHAAPILVPAMNNLHNALVASNLNFQVKVSTPQSMGIISIAFPPSTATFISTWNTTMYQLLQFLKNTNSYYMLNAYPYYGYTSEGGIFPLDYALFRPLSPAKQIVDPNTMFHYDSMFEAMVDAVYYSMAALNFPGIPVVVTETGWPWLGVPNEPTATVENAESYINNLVRRVMNNSGPPSQREIPLNTYIYELFNEDMRRRPISKKNWGIFYSNGSEVYSLALSSSSRVSVNGSVVFCIARPDADSTQLQSGLNWACGTGGANCSAIQQGQPCYTPDTLENHASYAYNDYYQKMYGAGGTCNFSGTAYTTTTDPSYGSCIFTGSSGSNLVPAVSPTASAPVSPSGGGSDTNMLVPGIHCLVIGIVLHLILSFG